ncbi:hypothetical protein KSP40_PGU002451 [Platanthera guangdongensis]|uniref:Uncharacterized protein n=1 Tax=Platanthera guangdongensis TaxID=2320717 RepID=A0ABR2N3L1_9ASPA
MEIHGFSRWEVESELGWAAVEVGDSRCCKVNHFIFDIVMISCDIVFVRTLNVYEDTTAAEVEYGIAEADVDDGTEDDTTEDDNGAEGGVVAIGYDVEDVRDGVEKISAEDDDIDATAANGISVKEDAWSGVGVTLRGWEIGTEYLIRPIARPEEEEDASDFDPVEENDDDEEIEEDDTDGDVATIGKEGTSAKRKRFQSSPLAVEEKSPLKQLTSLLIRFTQLPTVEGMSPLQQLSSLLLNQKN